MTISGTQANRAHAAVAVAIKRGILTPLPCESCGAEKTQAHHDDYTKRLDVRWLCVPCHSRWHREHRSDVNWRDATTTPVAIRVTDDEKAWLERYASSDDRSVHYVLRQALREFYYAHVEETP